jgi:two-component system nitrate/nitrite response regulator NarL
MKKALNFLIVDDHPFHSTGLKKILESRSYVSNIKIATNAHEGKESVRLSCPDVILMDLSMEEVNGVACTKIIKERWPEIKVIGLYRYDEIHLVNELLIAGAIGAVNKTCNPPEFLEKLETMLQVAQTRSHNLLPMPQPLAKREIQILRLLGKAMSSKEIASQLYISKSTVDNHRKRILKKTGLPNTAGAVNWATQNGIISKDEY